MFTKKTFALAALLATENQYANADLAGLRTQLSTLRNAIQPHVAQVNAQAGTGYFASYYFIGTECEETTLAFADVLTTGSCIESSADGGYVKFACDDSGLSWAAYSDSTCETMIENTGNSQSATMNTCTLAQGVHALTVCETSLRYNVDELSHATGYFEDETCSDDDQELRVQYFVTGECLTNDAHSREYTCNEEGMVLRFFDGPGCNQTEVSGVSFFSTNVCQAPFSDYTNTTENNPADFCNRQLTCYVDTTDDDAAATVASSTGALIVAGLLSLKAFFSW